MDQSTLWCPKCDGEMADGFVVDNTYGAALVSQWMKGAPKARTLFGRILNRCLVKYPKADETIPIGTFRCQSCGYLESYARDEFAAQ